MVIELKLMVLKVRFMLYVNILCSISLKDNCLFCIIGVIGLLCVSMKLSMVSSMLVRLIMVKFSEWFSIMFSGVLMVSVV